MTPFAIGQRWFCTPKGRARFWYVIIGPGTTYANKPSDRYKRCRIEVHPEDIERQVPGYKHHGQESTYAHKHLKKHGVLGDVIGKFNGNYT